MMRQGEDPTKLPVHRPHPSPPPPPPPTYGTFSHPSAPPPPLYHSHHYQPPCHHVIPVGYQSHPYSTVVEGIPMREPRLPCCGVGIGWALFISGFFIAAVPWYVGTFIFLFVAVDYREKAGLIACTVGAILSAITLVFGATNANFAW